VRERDPDGGGRARSRERGVRVAETTTASGRSASTTLRTAGVSASTSAVRRSSRCAGLRQPELLEEDLRELGVPVLARVDDDLVDVRLAERHESGADLTNCGRLPDDGQDAHRAPA
jgi:hypothetical protein